MSDFINVTMDMATESSLPSTITSTVDSAIAKNMASINSDTSCAEADPTTADTDGNAESGSDYIHLGETDQELPAETPSPLPIVKELEAKLETVLDHHLRLATSRNQYQNDYIKAISERNTLAAERDSFAMKTAELQQKLAAMEAKYKFKKDQYQESTIRANTTWARNRALQRDNHRLAAELERAENALEFEREEHTALRKALVEENEAKTTSASHKNLQRENNRLAAELESTQDALKLEREERAEIREALKEESEAKTELRKMLKEESDANRTRIYHINIQRDIQRENRQLGKALKKKTDESAAQKLNAENIINRQNSMIWRQSKLIDQQAGSITELQRNLREDREYGGTAIECLAETAEKMIQWGQAVKNRMDKA